MQIEIQESQSIGNTFRLNRAVLLMVLFFVHTGLLAQEFKPLKSPDVTEFMKSNYLPMNEYSGRADVQIPLYEIDLDGLKIPIIITYNTGGVQVNSAATRVGLNWSLSAGGLISKEIVGDQDTYSLGYYSQERAEYVYNKYGYLMHLWQPPGNYAIPEPLRDTQPDLFHVSAPGLITKFTHKSDGSGFELSNTGAIIKSLFEYRGPYSTANETLSGMPIEIVSQNGFSYTFFEREYNTVFPRSKGSSDIGGLPDDLEQDPWPTDKSEEEVLEALYGNTIGNWGPEAFHELFPNIYLASIKSPQTNKSVDFSYAKNFIVDNHRRIERHFSLSGDNGPWLYGQTNFEHDYSMEKLIEKIDFPEGTVNFYYDDRLDISGGKKLTKIEVRNLEGKLVKGILFQHDYFTTSGCSDVQCLRLKLTGVQFYNSNGDVLPGYSFDYNAVSLPKRYSLNQDYAGYFNGYHGQPLNNYIPKVYYKANQGRYSYLPFQIDGYSLVAGNVGLEADLSYAKAGILEKITYPTGGYSSFEYELNEFDFLGNKLKGFGLRVVSQSLYNQNNSLKKKVSYEYINANGSTSGEVADMPSFLYYFVETGIKRIVQANLRSMRQTKNGNVGYSRVIIAEQGNGYVVNNYSNLSHFPNIYPVTYEVYNSQFYDANIHQELIDAGAVPEINHDMDVKRGRLLSSEVYNDDNEPVQLKNREYEYKSYDEIDVHENYTTDTYISPFENGSNLPYARYNSKLHSESYELKEEVSHDQVVGNTQISTTSTYDYVASYPFIKERKSEASNGKMTRQIFYYPFDNEVSSEANVNSLNDLNILRPVKNEIYEESNLLITSHSSFGDFEGKILPTLLTKAQQGSPQRKQQEFHVYDKKGNVAEYSNRNGIHVSVLWAHNYEYKIAEVVGATYSEVLTTLGAVNSDYLQLMSNSQLETELDKLRSGLQHAQIYTYTQEPLIGIRSITEPGGLKNSYEYDGFNRLTHVKDHDGNILKKYSYHHKLNPTATIQSINLQATIDRLPAENYESNPLPATSVVTLRANVVGGTGDYAYEWKLDGTGSVLGRTNQIWVDLACGASPTYQLKVTDSSGSSLTITQVIYARNCGEAFYVAPISVTSGENSWSKKCEVEEAQGGSFKFSYNWTFAPSQLAGGIIYSPRSRVFYNTSADPLTYTVTLVVTDLETNQTVTRTATGSIDGEYEIPSCFIAGTKILMADGSEKKIEDIKTGERILTYNIESKSPEIGEVENTVSPIHKHMIDISFIKGIKNTNTLDHPYYIKGKGWASYDPKLTFRNYELKVKKMEVGDVAFLYDRQSGNLVEVEIENIDQKEINVVTYNLDRVSKNHNFFANGILVHNKYSGLEKK